LCCTSTSALLAKLLSLVVNTHFKWAITAVTVDIDDLFCAVWAGASNPKEVLSAKAAFWLPIVSCFAGKGAIGGIILRWVLTHYAGKSIHD